MNITITPNDYAEVTECREDIVQHICDAFLNESCWSEFYPNRHLTNWITISASKKCGFHNEAFARRQLESAYKIRKCEVELAIDILISGGYHLYRWYHRGETICYQFSKSPRRNDREKVSRIYDGDWSHTFR